MKERKFFLIKPRIYIEFSKDGLCQDHFYKAYKLSKCLSNLGEKIFSSNGWQIQKEDCMCDEGFQPHMPFKWE